MCFCIQKQCCFLLSIFIFVIMFYIYVSFIFIFTFTLSLPFLPCLYLFLPYLYSNIFQVRQLFFKLGIYPSFAPLNWSPETAYLELIEPSAHPSVLSQQFEGQRLALSLLNLPDAKRYVPALQQAIVQTNSSTLPFSATKKDFLSAVPFHLGPYDLPSTLLSVIQRQKTPIPIQTLFKKTLISNSQADYEVCLFIYLFLSIKMFYILYFFILLFIIYNFIFC